jgi:hypothetical protein
MNVGGVPFSGSPKWILGGRRAASGDLRLGAIVLYRFSFRFKFF